jgi:hypothetical protein
MSEPPDTYAVLNAEIQPQTMARLLSLHDVESGVLVCHPVPPATAAGNLTPDVLYALGKHPSTRGWPRNPRAAERSSTIWLQAERITDVLLLRAELFAHTTLAELVALNRRAGARTWLIFDSLTARRAAASHLGALLATQVQITPRGDQPSTPTKTLTRWPPTSPWLARSSATRAFTVDQLNALDARMHAAFNNTSSWLSAQRQLSPEATERFLALLTSDASQPTRYARILGASSALLLHGIASEIHERSGRRSATARNPTSEQAREIRRHSNPASAALKAITMLTDIDAETLSYLTLDQLIQTPRGVVLGDHLLQNSSAAALRAHTAHQGTQGQPSTVPMFTRRQLAENRDARQQKNHQTAQRLDLKLAALTGSLDLTFPQPQLASDFRGPAEDTYQEAQLIVRLPSPQPLPSASARTSSERRTRRRATSCRG